MPQRLTQTAPPDTRERILAAADDLFGERGFDATTTREIGERSGANKALIHYHFRNKQALWNCVLDRYYDRLGEALRPALTAGGDVRARLIATLGAYVDFLAANLGFSRMVQREISGGRHLERITAHMLPLFEAGSGLLQARYPATARGPLAAPQLMISVYGMVVSYFTYTPVLAGLLGADPLAPACLAERKAHLECMAELILGALEAAASPTPPPGGEEQDDPCDS